jgi:D-inositol-3-phosphate glycosyltransferase
MGDRRIVAERSGQARPSRVAMITMHTSPTATLGHNTNGGLNVYVREVCSAFSRRGIATDVFVRRAETDPPVVERLAPLSRVTHLPAGPGGLDKYQLLDQVPAFADRIARLIEESGVRYDAIHSHYWLSGLVACALHGRLGVPWAHTAHTLAVVKNHQPAPGAVLEPAVRVSLEGEISRCADLLVVHTRAEGDDLCRAYQVPRERIAVVPPGVDLDTFRPQARDVARREVGHPSRRLFVFVGRLEPLKGVDVILRAFAQLTAGGRHPDALLLVVGEDSGADGGGERERLRRLTGELGLTDRVEFGGSVDQRRLPAYYAAAEACLMPSYSESFGLVGLEAQACGTALIASNVAGLASVVKDGVTGFLVEGPDPAAYADRMRRLLEEPGLAERMGQRGRRLALGFSWDRTAGRLLERMETLTAAPLLAT